VSFGYRAFAVCALSAVVSAAGIAAVPMSAASADPANVIVNGSFESPSIWQTNQLVEYEAGSTAIPGWSIGGNSIDLVGENYWQAEDGDQSIDLSGSAPGSVSQTVATTPGQNYTLTWYMAGNTNCGQAIKTMDVSWNGTLVDAPTFNDSGDSNGSMGWEQMQLNVTATGASSVVEFADATPDMSECGATLDNVSLMPASIAAPGFTEDSPALSTLAGTPYSAIFFATGVPTYSLVNAPSWLSITQFGAVTGTPPAGTTSFTYSVSASNADGHAQAGPFTVAVQAAATVSGTVVDGGLAATPVSGAAVQACVTGSSECQETTTAAGGTFRVSAPVGSSAALTAFPLPGSGDVATSTEPMTIPAAGVQNITISLDGLVPLTGGLEINGSTAPTVYWANPSTATLTGCPDGLATVSIIGENTSTGLFTSNVIVLTETPAGSGNYSGVIPPQEPIHGPVQVESSVSCPPQSELAPNEGPATGATTVYLTGSGFSGATAVRFGGTPAQSFTVLSDNGIQAVAPAGTGTVPVTVTAGASTVTVDQYTYQAVDSISRSSGPAGGGTWVIIKGTGLDSANSVEFGSTGAEFYQLSNTEIEALSPPGTGTQHITVSTDFGGTTPVTAADEFTYTGRTAGITGTGGKPRAVTAAAAVPRPVTPAAIRTVALARPDVPASAAGLSLRVLNFIYQNAEFLRSALGDVKTALDNDLPTNPSCSSSREALQDDIEGLLSPIVDTAVDAVLPAIESAEVSVGLAGGPVGIAISIVVFSITPVLLHWAVDQLIERDIEAALDALYGPCPPEPPPPPPLPPPLPQPGNTPPTNGFTPNTEIDPSGTVLDTNGNPVSGATVTILRADTSAGPYTPANTAQAGIDPAVNPETTGSDGVFHWDVYAGWYEVQASAPGCSNPANPNQSTVTIGPYPVPPPQVGLTITLACANEAPAPTPTVTSLSQNSGPPGGGTTLTVLGSGFTPSSVVTFGGTKAQGVTYLSPQVLSVTSPAGSGMVDVQVQTAGGTSAKSAADQFFYGAAPAVTKVSPSGGLYTGGTVVTITGTGFSGATGVFFGGMPATSYTVVSGTEIQATAPAEPAGTVDVTVVNPAGASALSSADQFTYTGKPIYHPGGPAGTGGVA
jgi:choice-of-anchor C domain-containing protein